MSEAKKRIAKNLLNRIIKHADDEEVVEEAEEVKEELEENGKVKSTTLASLQSKAVEEDV
jgi:DNA polymerase elongation subunit (family B)